MTVVSVSVWWILLDLCFLYPSRVSHVLNHRWGVRSVPSVVWSLWSVLLVWRLLYQVLIKSELRNRVQGCVGITRRVQKIYGINPLLFHDPFELDPSVRLRGELVIREGYWSGSVFLRVEVCRVSSHTRSCRTWFFNPSSKLVGSTDGLLGWVGPSEGGGT